ncbi:MAG: ABC transporter permease [Chloroflexi bacterium]|nr:ABC transporter permease [Chloroflexota bacterium]
MASATRTYSPGEERQITWRDILLTRTGIFSIIFILFGVWALLASPAAYGGGTTTTFATGPQSDPRRAEIAIPTLGFVLFVGLLYVGGGLAGVAGLVSERAAWKRAGAIWLVLNGILIIPTILVMAAAGTPGGINVVTLLQISVRLATPVTMGALAGIWCERAGVVNIAIEGMMLAGACFGFITFTLLLGAGMDAKSAQFLGVMAAVFSGWVMSVLHAWLAINFKIDQIVSGTVINILALGLTSFARREVLLSSEAGRETLQPIVLPILSDIPILGPVLFEGRPIFYSMFALLIITHIVLYYTRWGLRTRAVGENPHAADTLGINVQRMRWINVMIGGMIAGLAGAWFSLETSGTFDDGMTGGRGFIALAAMIFGKWTPVGAFSGGLLFGFSDVLGFTFQGLNVPVPSQFVQMVPYVTTIIVLAGLVGRATAPKADGVPYEKEGK